MPIFLCCFLSLSFLFSSIEILNKPPRKRRTIVFNRHCGCVFLCSCDDILMPLFFPLSAFFLQLFYTNASGTSLPLIFRQILALFSFSFLFLCRVLLKYSRQSGNKKPIILRASRPTFTYTGKKRQRGGQNMPNGHLIHLVLLKLSLVCFIPRAGLHGVVPSWP